MLQLCPEQTQDKNKMGNLKDEEGHTLTEPRDKANLMNAFFSSAFTQEDVSNMPYFERRPLYAPL